MEVVDALPGWVREFRAQPELATRSLPVRWAVVVDGALPAGLVTNAVACVGAAVAALVPAVVGEGATDASGTAHPARPPALRTVSETFTELPWRRSRSRL